MNKLWYYRRASEVIGPVPLQAIERYLILGRLGLDDLVSSNEISWMKISDCPELAATCQLIQDGDEAKLSSARRFSDERNQERRVGDQDLPEDQRRIDRRGEEPPEIAQFRANRAFLFEPQRERNWMSYILLACLIGLVTLAIIFYQPVNPIKIGLTRH